MTLDDNGMPLRLGRCTRSILLILPDRMLIQAMIHMYPVSLASWPRDWNTHLEKRASQVWSWLGHVHALPIRTPARIYSLCTYHEDNGEIVLIKSTHEANPSHVAFRLHLMDHYIILMTGSIWQMHHERAGLLHVNIKIYWKYLGSQRTTDVHWIPMCITCKGNRALFCMTFW